MIKEINVIKTYRISIPDDKIDKHLKDFREVIQDNGTVEDLFEHIAWNLSQGTTFIEGVGRIKEDEIDLYSEKNEYKATDINGEEIESICEIS